MTNKCIRLVVESLIWMLCWHILANIQYQFDQSINQSVLVEFVIDCDKIHILRSDILRSADWANPKRVAVAHSIVFISLPWGVFHDQSLASLAALFNDIICDSFCIAIYFVFKLFFASKTTIVFRMRIFAIFFVCNTLHTAQTNTDTNMQKSNAFWMCAKGLSLSNAFRLHMYYAH